jgi:hypothetical protein
MRKTILARSTEEENHKLNNVNPFVNTAYTLGFYVIIEREGFFYEHAKKSDLIKNPSLLYVTRGFITAFKNAYRLAAF